MRWLKIGILSFFTIALVACGNGDTSGTNNGENVVDETEEQLENTQDHMDDAVDDSTDGTNGDDSSQPTTETPYGFTDFSFEADMEGTDDFIDIDYEFDQDEVEASYRDQQNDVNLTGDEALQELDNIFQSFTFDENTPDEDVLNEVLEAFNVPEDATNVELEIEFQNGTEKEYHR